jgi:hypothetical protein
VAHQVHQTKNFHAVAQAPNGKGSAKCMGRAVLDTGLAAYAFEELLKAGEG